MHLHADVYVLCGYTAGSVIKFWTYILQWTLKFVYSKKDNQTVEFSVLLRIGQSAGVVEYTDCFSAEE